MMTTQPKDKKYLRQAIEAKQDPIRLVNRGAIDRSEAMDAIREVDEEDIEFVEPINENTLQNGEAEMLFEYLLGATVNDFLTDFYRGRGLTKVGGFRWSMRQAFDVGAFVVLPYADGTRTRNGNDENMQLAINKRLRALLGFDLMVRLQDAGRNASVSNLEALQIGVRACMDRLAL